jgi:hypothetical protein
MRKTVEDGSVEVGGGSCSTFEAADLDLYFPVLLVPLRFLGRLDGRVATSDLPEIAVTELNQLGDM